MIVVESRTSTSDADDAASIKTLVTYPKIPHYYPILACLSLPAGVIAFVCAIMNSAFILGHLNGLLTIFAFTASLPYQVFGILLIWLHSHQIESVLKFAPATRKNIALSIILALSWLSSAVMTGWIMWRVLAGKEETWCIGPDQCFGYVLRGKALVAPVLAFVFSSIEVIVYLAITVVCVVHARRQSLSNGSNNAPIEMSSSSDPTRTKVISP